MKNKKLPQSKSFLFLLYFLYSFQLKIKSKKKKNFAFLTTNFCLAQLFIKKHLK